MAALNHEQNWIGWQGFATAGVLESVDLEYSAIRNTCTLYDLSPMRTYRITGQVFFATADRFVQSFDFQEVIDRVSIDVSRAHFWDITAVSALDKVVLRFRREATEVEVIGLNEASATMVDRFAVHDKDGAPDLITDH